MKRQRKPNRRSLGLAGALAKRVRPRVQCAARSLLKEQMLTKQVSDRKSLAGGFAVQPLQEPDCVSVTHKPDSSGTSSKAERLLSCGHQTPAMTASALVSAVSSPDQKGVVEAVELQGLGSALKVTIQRGGDSRAFGQTSVQPEGQTLGQHHCHLCGSSCPSLQAFQLHMTGTEHQERLTQVTHVLKTAGKRADQPMKPQWCDTCQKHFAGDVILHRQTDHHKLCKQSSRPYCLVCDRHFRTPRKFVEHMKSPDHKQKVLLEETQEEELITVDAIGCFEGEQATVDVEVDEEVDKEVDKEVDEEVDKEVGEEAEVDKEVGEEVVSRERGGGEKNIAGEDTEGQDYDPDTVYGSSFVVPVTGFLCRLCQKFFDSEATARHTHCQTRSHYLKLQMHQTSGEHGNLTRQHTSTAADEGLKPT